MEIAGRALEVVAIVLLYAVHLGRHVRLNIRLRAPMRHWKS